MTKSLLLALALLAGAGPAPAQNRPSFDCAKAKDDVEKAICKDTALSALDRDLAAAYGEAMRRLDSAGRKALQEEQSGFLMSRDNAMNWPDTSLKDYMTFRLEFLRGIRAGASGSEAAAFFGEWKNEIGSVKIARGKGGKLSIEINTVAPINARWVCEVSGKAPVSGGALRFIEDDVKIAIRRSGSLLKVDETLPAGRGTRDYCGANGSVEGLYFKVK
jgi:uncharacterized protein YecT (DUF1311 family)